MQSLNDEWLFTSEWSDDFAAGALRTDKGGKGAGAGRADVKDDARFERVRLPHQPVMIPLHYATSTMLRMVCGYRRRLFVDPAWLNGAHKKRLFLQFDGAAHTATVCVNGDACITHTDGYRMFRTEITSHVHAGDDNLIAVRLDTFKDRATGEERAVSDELAYGGLYREVWLDVRGETYLDDLLVTTADNNTVRVRVTADGPHKDNANLSVRITDAEGAEVAALNAPLAALPSVTDAAHAKTVELSLSLKHARLWDLSRPYLYALTVSLSDEDGTVIDTTGTSFGVRTAEFRTDGFYLNRKKVFLRGLNRYQGFPYIGYAAPKRLQEEDARILKEDLRCNAVRIPKEAQSAHFVAACDRLGLLVFTEEVAPQYVNHPSVIFGDAYGAQSKVVNFASVQDKIIETDGDIFPTKSFDPWEKRQEQALRHARVLDQALSSGAHSGCFQWCLSDYQTHADYGSGDRVCYHGVLDPFRNPKVAAALYASQGDDEVFLSVACPMDAGDYTAGNLGEVYCFTNADEVVLYKGDDLVKRYMPDKKLWKGLKHPPVLVDINDETGKRGKAPVWQFIATKNGLTKEVTKGPGNTLHLDVRVTHTVLKEEETYDIAAVRVRLLDEHGNLASYAQLPVTFHLTGHAVLAGPESVTAEGGMCGTFVRSIPGTGEAALTIRTAQTDAVKISFITGQDNESGEA